MDMSRRLCRAGGDFPEVSQEAARSGHCQEPGARSQEPGAGQEWPLGDYHSLGGGDKEGLTIVAVALWLIWTEQNRETGGCFVWAAWMIWGPLNPPLRLNLLFLGVEVALRVIQCFSTIHHHWP